MKLLVVFAPVLLVTAAARVAQVKDEVYTHDKRQLDTVLQLVNTLATKTDLEINWDYLKKFLAKKPVGKEAQAAAKAKEKPYGALTDAQLAQLNAAAAKGDDAEPDASTGVSPAVKGAPVSRS